MKSLLRTGYVRPAVGGVFAFAALLSAFAGHSTAEPPSRLVERLQDGQTFTLRGSIPTRAHPSHDQGAVAGTLALDEITFHLQKSDAQQRELTQLLADQQNRASARYHKWLTPAQFGSKYGLNDRDLSRIKSWLEAQGFKNLRVSPSRMAIHASATAAQVESALHAQIHWFQGSDRLHFANATDPVLPHALQGMVSGIAGLNDFHPRPRLRKMAHTVAERAHFTSSVSGNHYVAPGDFATIYNLKPLYNAGINGVGIKIAVAGQTDINLTQVNTFRSNAGLSVNTPTVVLGGTKDPGVVSDDQSEAYLDVEWAGAVAPNASVIYVNSTDVFTSVEYAIDNNLAASISITYGLCESQFGDTTATEALFQQANAQGITILAASGDTGAADCDGDSSTIPATASLGLSVDYPSSSPEVTGIGGTAFDDAGAPSTYWASSNDSANSSALSYIPEAAWNDSVANGTLAAGGGGISSVFAKPAWQTGDNVPSGGTCGSATDCRDVPDVSLKSSIESDAFLVCASDGTVTVNGALQQADCTNGFRAADQTLDAVGGTSAATPAFAGVVALINQAFGRQGNINPRLYELASSSTDAFHDVTSGDNMVACAAPTSTVLDTGCPSAGGTMGYAAVPGYDLATGIGSIDGQQFVSEWQQGFSVSPANPGSLTIAAGASGSSSVTITYLGGFSGTVSLSCNVSSALTSTTCSIPASVTGSGAVTVKVSNSNKSQVVPMSLGVRRGPLAGIVTAAVLVALTLTLMVGRVRPLRSRYRFAATGMVAIVLAVLTGCGGGSSSSSSNNTPPPSTPVTGTLTITAVSGSTSHSTTISVTQD